MKRVYIIIFSILTVLTSACIPLFGEPLEPSNTSVSTSYTPVIVKRSELKNSIRLNEVIPSNKLGKIYILGDVIFLNETNKGFHILDNNNPKQPIKKKFLSAMGATDVAVRNNTLYVNQATDLVVLNYNVNSNKLEVIKRLENVFPQKISPDGFYYSNLKNDEVIVDWKLK